MPDVKFWKSAFGAHRVSYDCPKCGERLRSPLSDAGQRDQCPECRVAFNVPGSDHLARVCRDDDIAVQTRNERRRLKTEEKQRQKEARLEQKDAARAADVERRKQMTTEREEERERQTNQEGPTNKPGLATINPKKRRTLIGCSVATACAALFWLTCGFFVIQPIGAIPDGVTIVYWRAGTKLPFVSSADGLLQNSDADVSLLGRGIVLAGVAKPIRERELFRFGYSRTLYLWSTGGREYSK